MRRRRDWVWLWLGVAILLALGALAWNLGHGPGGEVQEPDAFRSWFWTYRSLDLLVQVGLILAGALGVAAILPGSREKEGELCTWL